MRPATVHALAQLLRYTRGSVTTIEKWVEQTPPEHFAAECAEAIYVARGLLMQLDTTLATAPDAPVTAATTKPSTRPAPVAARSLARR